MVVIDNKKNIRSFGRINSRGTLKNTDNIIKNILPKYSIELSENIDINKIFNNKNKNYLEIGFGYGESIEQRSKTMPEINYIGCETYIKGVLNLVRKVDYDKLHNIKIFNGDARLLLENIKDDSIDMIFILFPDPWPKKKQQKRRIVNEEFLTLAYKKLTKNGKLFFASDIENYLEWSIEKVSNTKLFKQNFNNLDECEKEPKWWIKTKYQEKAIKENRCCKFLEWQIIKK